jgi:ankyrin repeat protein
MPRSMAESSEFLDAVKKGNLAAVKEWIAKDRNLVNAKTDKGLSAVTLAAYYGRSEVLAALLAERPRLSLHEAAIVGDLKRVKEAVDKSPALANDTSSPDGFPPLGLAAHFGRSDVVRYLLGKGASVNFAAAGNGFTALTGAIAGGHREVVRILLDAGANVNHRYEEQRFSPLLAASADGDAEIVRMLIAAGADVTARTTDGKTPVSLAEGRGHGEIAEILRKHGAK